MDLEIQCREIELDPRWRDLIEHEVARISEHYPETLRLHVTLRHGAHHRRGTEGVVVMANLEGATLRAEKYEEHVRDAIHAAFAALETELARHHVERRHVTKSPNPRPQGSIKRIFRDGGYGFIHYLPGRDVYFHRAALHEMDFETLRPGTPVEFEIEEGEEGLQASRVFPVGERGRT